MKFSILSLIFCLLAAPALAQQQRIPDLSMSPEETLRQPDVSHSTGTINNGYVPQNSGLGATSRSMDSDAQDLYSAGPSTHFMAGYCDPNFQPIIANSPGLSDLKSCLESQKQQTCQSFEALPADAQAALDNTIGCLYAASENGDSATDCTAGDLQRLRLLKKYWRNDPIASALVFMPDDVLNVSAKCLLKR